MKPECWTRDTDITNL